MHTDLLFNIVQVDVPDEFGATPLLCAARRGATISSLYLSKRGANLKTRDNAGNDTLGIALAGGHDQYAKIVLYQSFLHVHNLHIL